MRLIAYAAGIMATPCAAKSLKEQLFLCCYKFNDSLNLIIKSSHAQHSTCFFLCLSSLTVNLRLWWQSKTSGQWTSLVLNPLLVLLAGLKLRPFNATLLVPVLGSSESQPLTTGLESHAVWYPNCKNVNVN